jgi:hypothetical protein
MRYSTIGVFGKAERAQSPPKAHSAVMHQYQLANYWTVKSGIIDDLLKMKINQIFFSGDETLACKLTYNHYVSERMTPA